MAGVQFQGNFRSAPVWAGDFGGREHVLPAPAKLDVAAFADAAAVVVTVGSAGALAGATTLPVDALVPAGSPSTTLIAAGGVLIPAGTTLYFGGEKVAVTTADAAIGATNLSVAALPNDLVDNDTARYSRSNGVFVPSGTFVGRTFAERAANAGFGPAAVTDDELYLTVFDVVDARASNDVELYRHRSLVKETFLPDAAALGTAANEVQTVSVDTILSGGKIGLTAVSYAGVPQTVVVAYNTSWTQTVADIQTALNAVLGTSAVAAAVTATKNMTLTFSGANYAGVAQPPVGVDISAATGPTKATVTRTTPGGTALLTKLRSLYDCITGAA